MPEAIRNEIFDTRSRITYVVMAPRELTAAQTIDCVRAVQRRMQSSGPAEVRMRKGLTVTIDFEELPGVIKKELD